MVMDILIFIVFILTIFLSVRKGFALTVVNFFKGFVSLIAAWFLCDDAADWLMTKTEVGINAMDKINEALSSKWEDSDIYMALPEIFKENGGNFAHSLILDGAGKLAGILLTIVCFVLIVLGLRLVLSVIGGLFSHKKNDGFVGTVDWLLGLTLGIVLGFIYVLLFLALLVPVAGLLMPQYCETIMIWLDESFVAGDLYNNNILLLLFRDFMA